MFARIAAITFILVATSVAWFVLGGTINYRTNRLRPGVSSIWGSPHDQGPPVASFEEAFSYAFLQGFTGLAVTIGCIVTLFVVMTAGIKWAEKFARPQ